MTSDTLPPCPTTSCNEAGDAPALALPRLARIRAGRLHHPLASTTATEEFLTRHYINYTKKTILIPTY